MCLLVCPESDTSAHVTAMGNLKQKSSVLCGAEKLYRALHFIEKNISKSLYKQLAPGCCSPRSARASSLPLWEWLGHTNQTAQEMLPGWCPALHGTPCSGVLLAGVGLPRRELQAEAVLGGGTLEAIFS